ncbi:MAG TPA: hypothetical protein VHX63_07870 [Acidobacteriaceae bacterium]|jgi:hypothetical protein|nr:hypothetical protein [Acidobacteriaceae bacterium]
MDARRWAHFTAMALIGDGLMAIVNPHRDVRAWTIGPKPWRTLMRGLGKHPQLTRALGVAQVVAGIYWAMREEEKLLE